MDAFFASVEQRDFPEYRGKPLVVGGSKARGVVAAASYEARKYGVRSAMPSVTALRKCPHLIFARPRFDVYKEVSDQIQAIFLEYTDLVEPLSLDEAYLDVTENKPGIRSAIMVAREIKQKIWERTGLTASAGVSFCKFLAKIASDLQKPNGLTVILPQDADRFIDQLAIEKIHGIGKVTAAKMKSLGIHLGRDLKEWEESALIEQFGKAGSHYYRLVHGLDHRPVRPDRTRKSIGAERTFEEDYRDAGNLLEHLATLADKVTERWQKAGKSGRTVTLKIKYSDFTLHTRSKTLLHPVHHRDALFAVAHELLHTPMAPEKPVRLLGISLSNLEELGQPAPGSGMQLKIPFPGKP
jgi:DNA polymerase-4